LDRSGGEVDPAVWGVEQLAVISWSLPVKERMTMAQSYQDLIAWQKAMPLVTEVYKATESFPKEEIYGLTSQLRRAAVSVPSNITEDQGRLSKGEFQQFLGYARGSLLEVETLIRVAVNLNYLSDNQAARLLDLSAEVGKILNGLLNSISER
jgi:four helix bundle protein